MARQQKAWKDLAPSTRARYERAARKLGISARNVPSSYVLGFIPSTLVYGKKPARLAPGEELTDRQSASMVRLARRAGLKSVDVDDVLNRATDAGMTFAQIEKRLKEREALNRMSPAKRKEIGRARWDTRRPHEPAELYWY